MPTVTPLVPDEPPAQPERARALGGTGPVSAARPAAHAPASAAHPQAQAAASAVRMLRQGADSGRLTHLEHLPARPGQPAAWPAWVPEQVTDAFRATGVRQPWAHQAAAAEHARSGRSVIIATGTASGKSLGYLLPALSGVLAGGTALYLAPTRALAADQLRLVQALGIPGVRAAVIDGDTPAA